MALALEGGTPVRTRPFPPRRPFGEREIELLRQAVLSQNLFGPTGELLPRFCEAFAHLYGVHHAVATSSGTSAIHAAVAALDMEPGDEIITAPITDLGTVLPILYQMAIPVFADVDDTGCIDPVDVEANITPRTRAILAVHLFGNACRIDELSTIANRHRVALIEDCSQAHLTTFNGRLCGTFGDIGAFSLQQSKHMTTGDGGMSVTRSAELWEQMRLFVDKGWANREWGSRNYVRLGLNYHMTELQAAVGLAQLERVEATVRRRIQLGDRLTASIDGMPGIRPAPRTPGARHTYWTYPLAITGDASRFAAALSAEGVPAGAGYIRRPIFLCAEPLRSKVTFGRSGLPFHPMLTDRRMEYTEDTCPHAQRFLDHLVVLSLHEDYAETDVDDMAEAIRKVAAELGR